MTDELITNFHRRRKSDKMKLRNRIRDWYKEDVKPFKALILNAFVISMLGGAAGALVVLAVYVLGR